MALVYLSKLINCHITESETLKYDFHIGEEEYQQLGPGRRRPASGLKYHK